MDIGDIGGCTRGKAKKERKAVFLSERERTSTHVMQGHTREGDKEWVRGEKASDFVVGMEIAIRL